jgi:hypothetical protein
MLKHCGKDVHRLRTGNRISYGQLSTDPVHTIATPHRPHGKPRLIPKTLPTLSTDLSTRKNHLLHLLTASFPHFPQPLLLEPQKKI